MLKKPALLQSKKRQRRVRRLAITMMSKLFRNVPFLTQEKMSPVFILVLLLVTRSAGRREAGA